MVRPASLGSPLFLLSPPPLLLLLLLLLLDISCPARVWKPYDMNTLMREAEKDMASISGLLELDSHLAARRRDANSTVGPLTVSQMDRLMFGLAPPHVAAALASRKQTSLAGAHGAYGEHGNGLGDRDGSGGGDGNALEAQSPASSASEGQQTGAGKIRFRGEMKLGAESSLALENKAKIEMLTGACSCPWPCPGAVPHDGHCNCSPRTAKCGFCMNGCLAAIEGFKAADSCYQYVLGAKGFCKGIAGGASACKGAIEWMYDYYGRHFGASAVWCREKGCCQDGTLGP